ncbi:hypothetical protein ACOME3_008267, partial [Neoechinorhynchus agilis]
MKENVSRLRVYFFRSFDYFLGRRILETRRINLGNAGGGRSQRQLKQDPPVIHHLPISIEDILKGTTKKMKVSRKVMESNNRPRIEDKVLTIQVKPGWKAGTKITFPKEGDQLPNSIPADVVFIVEDKPHPRYKRQGSDVVYTARISLRQALIGGFTVQVPLIEGGQVPLKIGDEVVSPATQKRIS